MKLADAWGPGDWGREGVAHGWVLSLHGPQAHASLLSLDPRLLHPCICRTGRGQRQAGKETPPPPSNIACLSFPAAVISWWVTDMQTGRPPGLGTTFYSARWHFPTKYNFLCPGLKSTSFLLLLKDEPSEEVAQGTTWNLGPLSPWFSSESFHFSSLVWSTLIAALQKRKKVPSSVF